MKHEEEVEREQIHSIQTRIMMDSVMEKKKDSELTL
jgi:hypothetical protein